MTSEQLLEALWKAQTKEEQLAILKGVPHKLESIARRSNNSHGCELGSNPYVTLIEGVTNAHDAVIMDWVKQNRFPENDKPTSVIEALDYIAQHSEKPWVHIYHQKGSVRHRHTITICDDGCGMTEEKMINGPLDIGSPDKTLDPLQHGNYGQGGATLFGKSESSLIVTRLRNSNKYLFTLVFKNETDDEQVIENYVYITHPNGSLFTANADKLSYSMPGKSDWAANKAKRLILPEHGTVRRNFGVDAEYWGYHNSSLYTSLSDRMFGSPGIVRLIGDENEGRLNQRRGRRHDLNQIPVGGKLKNGAEMLYRIPETNIELFLNKERLGVVKVAGWVIDDWGKDTDKVKTPVMTMLDGKDTGVPHGILVTLNGQTHGRERSTTPLRNAGFNNIISNTIIEVQLDGLSRKARRKAITPDRINLDEKFVEVLNKELVRFLKTLPGLAELNKQRDAVISKVSGKDIESLINDLSEDKILGMLAGIDTIGRGTTTGQNPVTGPNPGESQAVIKKDRVEDDDVPLVPFMPSDPPTFLIIHKNTVKRNQTEWVTITTDAPDHYVSQLSIVLPQFLSVVEGSKFQLKDGRFTFPVTVDDDAKVGDSGFIRAILQIADTKPLTDERLITVAAKTEKKQPGVSTETMEGPQQASFPKFEWQELDGHQSPNFTSVFGSLTETEPSFAYSYDRGSDTITVYVNKKFEMCGRIKDMFMSSYGANQGEIIHNDFLTSMTKAMMGISLMFYRDTAFDNSDDDDKHRVLARVTAAFYATIARRYQDREYRNSVITRSKNSNDE